MRFHARFLYFFLACFFVFTTIGGVTATSVHVTVEVAGSDAQANPAIRGSENTGAELNAVNFLSRGSSNSGGAGGSSMFGNFMKKLRPRGKCDDFDCNSNLVDDKEDNLPVGAARIAPVEDAEDRIVLGAYASGTALSRFQAAFPDIRFQTETAAEGDSLITRIFVTGVQATQVNCDKLMRFEPKAECYIGSKPSGSKSSGSKSSRDETVSADVRKKRAAIAYWAAQRAGARSQRRCGRFVRQAIELALDPVLMRRTMHASDFGPSLEEMGFRKIPSSGRTTMQDIGAAQPGDVVIIHRFGKHTSGHAVIKTLTGWASDFRQVSFNPYRQTPPSYTLYRYFGRN